MKPKEHERWRVEYLDINGSVLSNILGDVRIYERKLFCSDNEEYFLSVNIDSPIGRYLKERDYGYEEGNEIMFGLYGLWDYLIDMV